MRIALIGYGKMGKEVESLAHENGHEIVTILNSKNRSSLSEINQLPIDVAIEFTTPESAISNLELCLEAGIPVVTGTTGWYDQLPVIKEKFQAKNGSLMYASNFSIGVHVFFYLNKKLAAIMNKLPEYDISISEVHHLQKLDKPSGTAITLANSILELVDRKKKWIVLNEKETTPLEMLPVFSERKEGIIGFHAVNYQSPIDHISLTHEANSRRGFASGALAAAAWLKDKKGVFQMEDFVNETLFS